MRRESCYWDLKSGIEPKKQTAQIYKSLAKLKVTCHYSDIDMKGTELRAAAEREQTETETATTERRPKSDGANQ